MKTKINSYDLIRYAEQNSRDTERWLNFTALWALVMWIIFAISISSVTPASASNLTMQDKIRIERLQVCQKAIKEADIAGNKLELQELVMKCVLRMTWVYIVESATWKSEIRKNNFLWLKRTFNWEYWFHSFNTWYDCRLYFARKWAEFHYKKSARTFIYWFMINGGWKYGWSATEKESYTQTLAKVENNLELKRQYEYLYYTQ